MFNSKELFSKFSNQRAIIFQSSSGKIEQFRYDELIEVSKIVKSALQEFIKNDQNNIGVLFDHSAEIVPVILGCVEYELLSCTSSKQ